MGTDGLERLERALERTLRSGTCRFRAEVAGTPLDGEIDLEGGVARSQLGVSDLVPSAAPEQIHRGGTVYQHVGGGGDRPWIAMPVGTGSSDPTGMLDLLRGAVSARPSPDPGGGLDVEVDVEQASSRVDDPSAFRAWAEATGLPGRLRVTVRLDDEGRVRHVRGTLPGAGGGHADATSAAGDGQAETTSAAGGGPAVATPIEVEYTEFGGAVDIVVPPRHQIA